jgi:hypothetical protein
VYFSDVELPSTKRNNAGGSATNVNGTSNGAVSLSGFTGGLNIDMKKGNDNVTITPPLCERTSLTSQRCDR